MQGEQIPQWNIYLQDTAFAMILSLDEKAWNRKGMAIQFPITPLEILRIWMGHEGIIFRLLKNVI